MVPVLTVVVADGNAVPVAVAGGALPACGRAVPGAVDGAPRRGGELAVARPGRAPLGQEGTGTVELLDSAVAGVDDVDVARAVGGDPPRVGELAVTRPVRAPPLGQEGT